MFEQYNHRPSLSMQKLSEVGTAVPTCIDFWWGLGIPVPISISQDRACSYLICDKTPSLCRHLQPHHSGTYLFLFHMYFNSDSIWVILPMYISYDLYENTYSAENAGMGLLQRHSTHLSLTSIPPQSMWFYLYRLHLLIYLLNFLSDYGK